MEKELAKSRIPAIGLGTWQLEGDECARMVREALELGYRHIDTAEHYGNEEAVGKAIATADREKLFLTTKAWPDKMGEEAIQQACDESLGRLRTGYLDLLLLHWPREGGDLAATFRGFKRLLDAGKVRAVGVSNFTTAHLEEALPLAEQAGVRISVNQVEYHPLLNQEALRRYCAERGITVTAYSPLARGEALGHAAVKRVAEEQGCTPAQAVLAWLLAKGLVVIPKASTKEHARENLAARGIALTGEQRERIDAIGEEKRLIEPEFAEFDKAAA